MTDQQHGHALTRQTADGIQHLVHQFGVKGGRHLIQQQDFRFQRQRAGDGDALLLATGQFIGIGVRLVVHADKGKQFHRLFLDLLALAAFDLGWGKGDVAQDVHVLEQVVLLEHDGHAIARSLDRAGGGIVDAGAVDLDAARSDGSQPDKRAQDGGFARPGRPNQRDDLPRSTSKLMPCRTAILP